MKNRVHIRDGAAIGLAAGCDRHHSVGMPKQQLNTFNGCVAGTTDNSNSDHFTASVSPLKAHWATVPV